MAIYHVLIRVPYASDSGTQIVTDDSGHWLAYVDIKAALWMRRKLCEEDGDTGDYLYQVMELEL